MSTNTAKIWFITGISSGFGRCLTEEVIARGDFAIGTMRNSEEIETFNHTHSGKAFAIKMDVNDRAQIEAGIKTAMVKYQKIDVLVNNAGYGLFGAIEEINEQEARNQMETNFFGPLFLTQAVLPFMRQARQGCIIQISSVAGVVSAPALGLYNASKYALEGFSEALAHEVAPLGIKVLIVEPGPFRTKWAGTSAKDCAKKIEDYAISAHATANIIHGYSGTQPGDPLKAARLIIEAANADTPPLYLPLGQMAIERIRGKISALQNDIRNWENKSIATAFE
jgi:NAD(P)-dependent dehydrogenase (short-subunit alcohol dehydrogenase family)